MTDYRAADIAIAVQINVAERSPNKRRPEPDDAVTAFQRRSFAAYFTGPGRSARSFFEHTSEPVRHVHVWAETAPGEIAGAMTLEVARGSARVTGFTVWPEFIGAGIGGKILAAAESVARSAGCTKLWAHTGHGLDNNGFYLRHGFAEEAVLRNHWAGHDRVIFAKALTADSTVFSESP